MSNHGHQSRKIKLAKLLFRASTAVGNPSVNKSMFGDHMRPLLVKDVLKQPELARVG
jgi:hypothetical protein